MNSILISMSVSQNFNSFILKSIIKHWVIKIKDLLQLFSTEKYGVFSCRCQRETVVTSVTTVSHRVHMTNMLHFRGNRVVSQIFTNISFQF